MPTHRTHRPRLPEPPALPPIHPTKPTAPVRAPAPPQQLLPDAAAAAVPTSAAAPQAAAAPHIPAVGGVAAAAHRPPTVHSPAREGGGEIEGPSSLCQRLGGPVVPPARGPPALRCPLRLLSRGAGEEAAAERGGAGPAHPPSPSAASTAPMLCPAETQSATPGGASLLQACLPCSLGAYCGAGTTNPRPVFLASVSVPLTVPSPPPPFRPARSFALC